METLIFLAILLYIIGIGALAARGMSKFVGKNARGHSLWLRQKLQPPYNGPDPSAVHRAEQEEARWEDAP